MYKFGVLGLGKMGSSILGGVLKNKLYEKKDIITFDKYPNPDFNDIKMASSEEELFQSAEIILLAIKPQVFPDVMPKAEGIDFSGRCVTSIAAGITTAYISKFFKNAFLVRVMPNTPALIGKAAAAISKTGESPLFANVLSIFKGIGTVYEIPESQMDDIVPVNGSMPAYLYYFAKIFIDKAVAAGIDYEVAKHLCAEAIIGSAEMILQSTDSIDTLIKNVCSPKGTTLEGLDAMNALGFKESVEACYDACARRSRELAKK